MNRQVVVVYDADGLEYLFNKILQKYPGDTIPKDELEKLFDDAVKQLRSLSEEQTKQASIFKEESV